MEDRQVRKTPEYMKASPEEKIAHVADCMKDVMRSLDRALAGSRTYRLASKMIEVSAISPEPSPAGCPFLSSKGSSDGVNVIEVVNDLGKAAADKIISHDAARYVYEVLFLIQFSNVRAAVKDLTDDVQEITRLLAESSAAPPS